jgi:hypothetical protein
MPTDAIATAAFKANPITFLGGAMILAPIGNATRHNRSEHFGLKASAWTGIRDSDNAAIPVWQVSKAPDGEPYFRSYIADYEQGTTVFTTLGANEHAEFCFTANMNGCTFGLGHPAPDGTLIVSHGNAANTGDHQNFDGSLMGRAGNTALQTSIQYSQAKAGHGVGGQVFEPEHYRIGQRQSVTFGYRARGTGVWSFYFVSYTRAQGVYTSYGVQPMQTNAITAT